MAVGLLKGGINQAQVAVEMGTNQSMISPEKGEI